MSIHDGVAEGSALEKGCGALDLIVTFSGLAVFARDGEHTVVLQPDARPDPDRKDTWYHLDDTRAEAHVGYLSFALGCLDPTAGPGEVVVKLDRVAISFEGLPSGQTDATSLVLPDFAAFAPVFVLDRNLLGNSPPVELLSRVHLPGGTLVGGGDGLTREVTRVLPSSGVQGVKQSSKDFANKVEWVLRLASACDVRVTLTSFDTLSEQTFVLKPVGGLVRLKIANLCGENPLEWDEFDPHLSPKDKPLEDLDFKWMSKLFSTKSGETDPVFNLANEVPHIVRTETNREQSLIYNCIPARAVFPPEA